MNQEFLHRIEDIVTGLGYECVHAALRSDFGRLKLQVLIDTLGGINAGDCELVSGHINKYLDTLTDIPELGKGRYYLEVSSPGIERPLFKFGDYSAFQGREVRIRLSKLIDGRKSFTGIISKAECGIITLLCDGSEINIPFETVKGGNLVYRFENDKKINPKRRKH
ncbi:MAG: ribosome maturation factor RimP [Synergistaceae bacterium]|nr:ribosome maturation factor RimP [Synergistaceae bacterium]MBQ9573780.1 ribosome maturation factor RimP [Synergistaceae bacterium]